MDWSREPTLEPVKGDTYCIVTAFSRIPLFKLDAKNVILIDSGLALERAGICRVLDREGMRVRAILTSHIHIDHGGNHRYFQKHHGAQIYMSVFDAAISSNPLAMSTYLHGDSYQHTRAYAQSLFCRPDHLITRKSDRIRLDGASFFLVPLDGHAPEHLGYITPDNVAYVADSLMTEDVLRSVRIPYCNCCQVDLESKRRAGELPCDRFILAHNGVVDPSEIRDLTEKNINSLLERIEIVASLADHYITMSDLIWASAKAMGARLHTPAKILTAEQNLRAFIEFLIDRNVLIGQVTDGRMEYIRTELL